MNTMIVGIGECAVSNDVNTTLITYALGSCVGLALFDPFASVGGLLHVMLPEASMDANRSARQPCLFADTGLAVLLDRTAKLGAVKSRLCVWLAGGSAVMDDRGIFNIGKRNELAMRKALWKAGLMVHGEDVGGNHSRTVRLDLSRGAFWVHAPGSPEHELKARTGRAKEPERCR